MPSLEPLCDGAISITGAPSFGCTARLRERGPQLEREVHVAVVPEAAGEPVRLIGHRFQNPCDGMRNARLKREDAFSHAMIIVSSAMVSSS
jgi:hypothetical protein